MAVQIYVAVTGSKQGDFKGESTQKGREKMIPGVAFSYGVISPRDPASGLPTGKRQHQPVVFTKEWGASSPQFYTSAFTNETLTKVVFSFFSANKIGIQQLDHSVTLTNVLISSVKQSVQLPQAGGPIVDSRELQEISFTFQKIDIAIPNGSEAIDDWNVNV